MFFTVFQSRAMHIVLLVICMFGNRPGQCWSQETPRSPRPPSSSFIGFVPGDAFFSVKIPDEIPFHLSTLSPYKSDEFILHGKDVSNKGIILRYAYAKVPVGHSPWGYSGFTRCHITEFSEVHSELVDLVVSRAARDSTLLTQEANQNKAGNSDDKIMVLIVNRDFHFTKSRLFNRYNSSWIKPANEHKLKLKDPRLSVIVNPREYQPHVWLPEAVADDWKQAADVPPLHVTFPAEVDVTLNNRPDFVRSHVAVKFADIAVVAIPHDDPERAFRKTLNDAFYVANSDGVYRYRWEVNEEFEKTLHVELLDDAKEVLREE